MAFLPGKSHGQRSQVGYSPWDHRVRHTDETTMDNREKALKNLSVTSCGNSGPLVPSHYWQPPKHHCDTLVKTIEVARSLPLNESVWSLTLYRDLSLISPSLSWSPESLKSEYFFLSHSGASIRVPSSDAHNQCVSIPQLLQALQLTVNTCDHQMFSLLGSGAAYLTIKKKKRIAPGIWTLTKMSIWPL